MISRKGISRKHFLILIFGIAIVSGVTSMAVGKFYEPDASFYEAGTSEQTLKPFKKESLAGIVESRNGKPFVLAFWSVYCGICVKEMEVWRQIRDQYSGFDLVLVTTDPIENEQRINQVLEREDMKGFEIWAFADPIPARLRSVVDSKWRGELPRIHFYGPDGTADVHMGATSKKVVLDWLLTQEG